MFCCLVGRKFSRKCKHSVKCIKCRMEPIRKKKQVMVTYLKKDVADLIAGGHETNAFGRMDALIVEMNQSSCYDMIEQYCCCILEHLPTMQKERVCPEETVEAIATLIFAAARFPDLRELADLRKEFTKRYGTQMEAYINEEFVEKMQKKTFPQDKKLRLMQDIAQESSLQWDFKPFEHRISNPLSPTLDQPKIQFPSTKETIKQPEDVKKAENLDSEELINAENIKEYPKIIQMTRSEHDPLGSTEKIAGKSHLNVRTKGRGTDKRSKSVDDPMGSRDAEVVSIIPPYTQLGRDFNGTLEFDKEMNQYNRPFNLRPPYIKPKVTKSTSLETAVEGDPLVGQIPIKQAGAVGKKNSLLGDVNDQQSFISPLSDQTEDDDAPNGAIYHRRHLQRAFSDRRGHA